MEYADRNTRLANGNFNKSYKQLDFFPSINLSSHFSNNHKIRFSYGRSVWRPTDLQLNPTVYFRDISGEFLGNAALKPSYTNSYEFNYKLSFKKNSISATGFYKYMKDNIMTVRYLSEDSVYRNNPENLQGKQQDIGMEFTGDLNLLKWLNLNPSGNFYNSNIDGNVTNYEIKRRGNVWSVRMITNIKPLTNTRLQINAYYNSRTIGAQLYIKEIYGLNFSIRQSVLKNRLIISLAGDDILQTGKRKIIVEGDGFIQQITDIFPKHPVYTLNLTFKLNNYNRKQRENVEQGIGFF
jgi:outer membrane receptor protein involved in Fe transport